MHWLQVFATRFLIFNFLWNHKPEVSRARESRTHDSGHEHHVTNPKSSKYLQQKLRPIQLAEFGFIVWKIVLSIFTFKNLHYRCRCAYKNASFCSKNSAYLSLLNRIQISDSVFRRQTLFSVLQQGFEPVLKLLEYFEYT